MGSTRVTGAARGRGGAARGRVWRAYADSRRVLARTGSAQPALAALGDPRRRDVERWTAQLAERHDAYRATVEPLDATVAIVCVSTRPHLLHQVVANVTHQTHCNVELVFVTNSAGFDHVDLDRELRSIESTGITVTTMRTDPSDSLGRCLNAAADATTARLVAKFDDDDLYGPRYLEDALRAHAYAGAGVVGKHTYYAYVEPADQMLLRFPGHEFRYSSTLAGGTLVIDRERVGDLRFPDISLGEDRAFLAACHRRGVSTFSADRFNFVQTRGADNTWVVTPDEFAQQSLDVGAGLQRLESDR